MIIDKLIEKYTKDNNLTSVEFSWGTNINRYYFGFNQEGKEISFCYDTKKETIL